MDHLWTPWRMAYVRGKREGCDGCVFCRAAAQRERDVENLVVARSRRAFVLLNRYPYSYGHAMAIPYAHVSSLEALSADAVSDLMTLTKRTMRVLREIAAPPAFNIGANIGAAAGAGIAAHFHFHIVPRWDGDHNFMQAIGGTRVIPGSLEHILEEMRAAWEAGGESAPGSD